MSCSTSWEYYKERTSPIQYTASSQQEQHSITQPLKIRNLLVPSTSTLIQSISELETYSVPIDSISSSSNIKKTNRNYLIENGTNLSEDFSKSTIILSNISSHKIKKTRSLQKLLSTCSTERNNNTEQENVQEDIESSQKHDKRIGNSLLNLFRKNQPVPLPHLLKIKHFKHHPKFTEKDDIRINEGFSRLNEVSSNESKIHPIIVTSSKQEAPSIISSTSQLDKVKDCGWYWGPLSSEGGEDLLKGEPDGTFIVRDSSDPHYIFSLTFKLNGLIRHVRIDHDHGNFSFGPLTRFKSSNIVDFIEKAVAHSRSGRYLFFLHRRPHLGPMRVQLLHPYSRYKQSTSLQHMCRFVILKAVRKDLVEKLPLPRILLDYLKCPQYFFERLPST